MMNDSKSSRPSRMPSFVGSVSMSLLKFTIALLLIDSVHSKQVHFNNTIGFSKGRNSNHLRKTATVGTVRMLVVLMRFADHAGNVLPTVADITALMNEGDALTNNAAAPTGSMREYFQSASYGKLKLQVTVTDWQDIPQNEADCARGGTGLAGNVGNQGNNDFFKNTCLTAALSLVDPSIDFSQFDEDEDGIIDAIGFLHSGFDAYFTPANSGLIKATKSELPTAFTSEEGVSVSKYFVGSSMFGSALPANGIAAVARIGLISQAVGSFLGLPDLSDQVLPGAIDPKPGMGLGSWSLMANTDVTAAKQERPPYLDPWSKIRLGWATLLNITKAGTYSLLPSCVEDRVYKISLGFAQNEYLLIENRQNACPFDKFMNVTGTKTGGLAIYHIDENIPDFLVDGDEPNPPPNPAMYVQGFPGQVGWPANGKHYKVALLQADGKYELENGANGMNRGTSADLFGDGQTLGPSTSGAGPFPNTDGYAFKTVKRTGITISKIKTTATTKGKSISFTVTFTK